MSINLKIKKMSEKNFNVELTELIGSYGMGVDNCADRDVASFVEKMLLELRLLNGGVKSDPPPPPPPDPPGGVG